MALFKINRGPEKGLANVPYHEGYAYFTEDLGNLFIDIGNNEGDRVQVNSYFAEELRKIQEDGSIEYISFDDVALKELVYSKEDIDKVTRRSYTITLFAQDWEDSSNPVYTPAPEDVSDFVDPVEIESINASEGAKYQIKYMKGLQCGKNGDIPPTITYLTNQEGYNKINSAEALPENWAIVFYTDETLTEDIQLLVIDN